MGGNNPRTESEELEGLKGTTYKIRNRTNVAYSIREADKTKLEGVFNDNQSIIITYEAKVQVPSEVLLEPETIRIGVGETATLGYKLVPEGNYDVEVTYIMKENDNVANIDGNVITGREIGFGMIEVHAKGEGFDLIGSGAVMVSGNPDEGE